jgi:hypothetical protein
MHGGPLPTLALLADSPAINAGADCPPTDQRGAARVGACDLGAFEFGSAAPSANLEPPTLLALNSTGGPLVQLSFTAVSGAVRYEVEARRIDGLTWLFPLLNDSVLLDQGRYVLRLRACNEVVCSSFSNSLTVEITQPPIKAFVPLVGR